MQALALHQQGRLREAESLYRAVLHHNPTHFDAQHMLGVIHLQVDQPSTALELIDRALSLNPNSPEALSNRGLALRALKRSVEALASFEGALRLRPDYAQAYNNRGNALYDLGRAAEAVASYDRALQLRPDYPEALNNRGNALVALKRRRRALISFERALQLRPNYLEAIYNRANTLRELGRTAEALEAYDRAIALKPDFVEALNNRGNILFDAKRPDLALASYDRALQINPNCEQALENRGCALQYLKRHGEATAAYKRLIELNPNYSYGYGNLLHTRLHCCDWSDYQFLVDKVAAGVERGIASDIPFSFLVHSRDPQSQQNCARLFAADKHPASQNPVWTGQVYAHDKIRIAYLSADFHNHATAHLMADLFESHDRSKFQTYGISFGPRSTDVIRNRLARSFHEFADVRGLTDRAVAQFMLEREIDIAIDLKGYTDDCRTGIFAHRGAPIQVNYLGFPGTMGASYIDYIIADPHVIPATHDAFYDEQIVRLPDSYQPNDRKRRIAERTPSRAELGLPDASFVFACFNNNYKITPYVFDIWMRLLNQVDGSILWLLEDNEEAARHLKMEATKRGVPADRLVFAPRLPHAEHLARHRVADLFLDTFPYNAHTTTSDALWAGLPVVTNMGETFASRVAASLLHTAQLPELIAHGFEAYEALALKLATTPEMLAGVRSRLARTRTTCALFDTDRFRMHLEAAYVAMHARHTSGKMPKGFDVPSIVRESGSYPQKPSHTPQP